MIYLDDILWIMKKGQYFAVARFNDGEMAAIDHSLDYVSRGDQKVTEKLGDKLGEALTHRQDGYYVGLPDPKFASARDKALGLLADYDNLTSSVVFHDDNWIRSFREIPIYSANFNPIVWVGGYHHNLSNLPFFVDTSISVSQKNSMDDYWRTKDFVPPEGSLVLLSCGPLGRVLAKEWFEKQPKCTILEVGSVFDPVTQDVWRRYQQKRRRDAERVIEEWQNG